MGLVDRVHSILGLILRGKTVFKMLATKGRSSRKMDNAKLVMIIQGQVMIV